MVGIEFQGTIYMHQLAWFRCHSGALCDRIMVMFTCVQYGYCASAQPHNDITATLA
jgi:hypothetical protein